MSERPDIRDAPSLPRTALPRTALSAAALGAAAGLAVFTALLAATPLVRSPISPDGDWMIHLAMSLLMCCLVGFGVLPDGGSETVSRNMATGALYGTILTTAAIVPVGIRLWSRDMAAEVGVIAALGCGAGAAARAICREILKAHRWRWHNPHAGLTRRPWAAGGLLAILLSGGCVYGWSALRDLQGLRRSLPAAAAIGAPAWRYDAQGNLEGARSARGFVSTISEDPRMSVVVLELDHRGPGDPKGQIQLCFTTSGPGRVLNSEPTVFVDLNDAEWRAVAEHGLPPALISVMVTKAHEIGATPMPPGVSHRSGVRLLPSGRR